MKRLAAIFTLCTLFCSAFVAGRGPTQVSDYPDSLRSVYLYTEGIKQQLIAGDSASARALFTEAIRNDSTFAPAYFQIVSNELHSTPEQAVEYAHTAYRRDTTNKWYLRFYGQALIMAQRYDKALDVFRRLRNTESQEPDNYRILALLYDQTQHPFSAIAVLDSAELRFGRIPILSAMKRRLLITTRQMDKAVEEAQALVEEAPYEAENQTALGELYGLLGKDSLARAAFERSMQIDSTNLETLLTIADYHNNKQDYRALLGITKRLFAIDKLPLEIKINRFERLIADTRFYREYYLQLGDLALTLAMRYPQEPRVVKLYAGYLIATGQLDAALSLYKLHLEDQPPQEEYFSTVIDIENYLKHSDSAALYITRALELFPGKVEFHIAKGNIMNQAGQYSKGIKAYKQSLRYALTDSVRSVIWGIIGDTWNQIGEVAKGAETGSGPKPYDPIGKKSDRTKTTKESYKAYERSLGYWRDNVLVMNNYAYFLSEEQRDLERAFIMSSRVVELTDNNPTYLDTHAWVLFRLGRHAEARKIMQQAVALDNSSSPELLLHYGDILYALGETFLAQTYWQKALEKGYDTGEVERRILAAKQSIATP